MSQVMFVLPVAGGSGGAHSVMQEADAMRRIGVDAMVAVNAGNAGQLRRAYADLPRLAPHVSGYAGAEGLARLIGERSPDVVVATTNQSVHVVAAALKAGKIRGQRTAYYIQDYEPLFYAVDSDDWLTARASYGLVEGMVHFAKTGWLQEVVRNNHRVEVHKVAASVDHRVFYPRLAPPRAEGELLSIVAMLRPATPRRAPRRTVRIVNRVAHQYRREAACSVFGCADPEIAAASLELVAVDNAGVLGREAVGDLFRHADLFLDLSDYQAFGRSAIEAMACGAIPVVPVHGGAGEFARDGINAFVVDTRSDEAIIGAVRGFLGMTAGERGDMRRNAMTTALGYSPELAALSEISLLASSLMSR